MWYNSIVIKRKETHPMNKIDHRIHYIVVMDTETCCTTNAEGECDMTHPFVYDIGWQVTDKRGIVYESKSYVVKDIFEGEADLMKSAYYAHKIPQYRRDIKDGKRTLATYYEIRKDFLDTLARYGTKTVCAHNMSFDNRATASTQRWLTKSKYRFFFPYDVELWDTMKMAKDLIATMPTYKKFCVTNGFVTKHKTPGARVTAEVLYRFITKDLTFTESHTGLEDVDIERQIMAYCFSKHKSMAKGLYEKQIYGAQFRKLN